MSSQSLVAVTQMRNLNGFVPYPFIYYIVATLKVRIASTFRLTFSQTTIYASRFTTPESIEVTRYPASLEYKTFYHDAVPEFGTELEGNELQVSVEPIFHDAIIPLPRVLASKYAMRLSSCLCSCPQCSTTR
jgi:hypothetical protein